MFLAENTTNPVRNALNYAANRIFVVLAVDTAILAVCLGFLKPPATPNDPNLREVLAPALFMVVNFCLAWWFVKRGMDVRNTQ